MMNYFLFFEFAIFAIFIVTFGRDKNYTKDDKIIIIGALTITIFGTYVLIPMLFNFFNYILSL